MFPTPKPTLAAAPPSALDDLTDEIWEAICNVQDMDTSLMDFAKAVVRDVPLVQAAPELLAALQELADVSRSYLAHMDADDIVAIDKARAAIARATA